MDLVMGIVIGIGLSAACGCRLFVPFLGMGIAQAAGHLTLAPGFEWLGSTPALVALSTATALEIAGYYIPWVDNLLDTAATPAAAIAGTMAMAGQLGDASPLLQWSLAAIAGGGTALTVQGGTALTRAASTGTTGGLGNFVVSTLEWMAAFALTVLAIVVPFVALLIVLAIGYQSFRLLGRLLWNRPRPALIETP